MPPGKWGVGGWVGGRAGGWVGWVRSRGGGVKTEAPNKRKLSRKMTETMKKNKRIPGYRGRPPPGRRPRTRPSAALCRGWRTPGAGAGAGVAAPRHSQAAHAHPPGAAALYQIPSFPFLSQPLRARLQCRTQGSGPAHLAVPLGVQRLAPGPELDRERLFGHALGGLVEGQVVLELQAACGERVARGVCMRLCVGASVCVCVCVRVRARVYLSLIHISEPTRQT